MFDLSKQAIEIKCSCGRRHSATLKDSINARLIKCTCGASIQLRDDNNSVRKGVVTINNTIKQLGRGMRKFGR